LRLRFPSAPASGVSGVYRQLRRVLQCIPAPILYSSGQQINAQVPFELAGQTSVQMQLVNRQVQVHLAETRMFAVADHQPAIFLATAGLTEPVSRLDALWRQPLHRPCRNRAECRWHPERTGTNPAVAGSTVTLFANGLGQLTPNLTTENGGGDKTAVTLTPGVVFLDPNLAPFNTTTKTIPGTLNGVRTGAVPGARRQLPSRVPPSHPLNSASTCASVLP